MIVVANKKRKIEKIMEENPLANAGDTGLIPGPGRFPHVTGQLSLCTTATEPAL